MEKRTKYTQFKKQDLLDKLTELASLLSAGRRIDPNSTHVKMQLEAIQIELEERKHLPGDYFSTEDVGR